MTEDQKKILTKSIRLYGDTLIVNKAMRNLHDLAKYLELYNTPMVPIAPPIAEIAEAIIVLEQLKQLFSAYAVDQCINAKIENMRRIFKIEEGLT